MKSYRRYIFILLSAVLFNCSDSKDPNSITASGTIETVNVTVSSKVGGRVEKLNFNEGDRVRTGDLLIELDHELLDIQLRQAEAGVELANAQLKLLQSGARAEDIRQSEELLAQAKINLELAGADRDRAEELYRQEATTKKQYDDAAGRYDLALAQYNSARQNLSKVRTIVRPEEIESAKANLKRSIAAADLLRQNIQDCSIFAPADGFISKKFVEAGEIVTPLSSLLRISNLESVDLVIYVNEVDLGKVKLGLEADVSVDAFKDKVYKGTIIYISPEAEFTPKNIQTQEERTKLVFAVKIRVPNPQFELKPGLPADAIIRF